MHKTISLSVILLLVGLVSWAYAQGGAGIPPKKETARKALQGTPSYSNCRALLQRLQHAKDNKDHFNYGAIVLLSGEEHTFGFVHEINHETGTVVLKTVFDGTVTARTIHVEWMESVELHSGGTRLE